MLVRTVGLLIALLFVADAQDQKPKLTARELFYSAVQAPKPAAPVRPKAAPKRTPANEVASANKNSPPPASSSAQPAGPDQPDGGHVFTAALTTSAPVGLPLGLKYAILKSTSEVPVETVFHAGDRIQLRVETNGQGYLYIISRGSSGTWKPLFPSPEVEDGNNRVEGFHSYTLPEPRTLYALADTRIDDMTVGMLRTAYSRDLVIEKVDENSASSGPAPKPAPKKETAVYVVNPSGSRDSRLVADLELVHR